MSRSKKSHRFEVAVACIFFLTVLLLSGAGVMAQATAPRFNVGERMSYSIAFDQYQDVGYLELATASRGKLSGADAVELTMRLKTTGFFRAAFFEIDEERTTFVSPETGQPLFATVVTDPDGIRGERQTNFAKDSIGGFDLVSLVAKLRAGGSGTVSVVEDGKSFDVTYLTEGAEKVETRAGEFDASIIGIESPFLTERGIKQMQMLVSNDADRIPVAIRFRRDKRDVRIHLISHTVEGPEPAVSPTPTPVATPVPRPSPRPTATPVPYVPNQPLASDLAFKLGEALEYRLTVSGRAAGTFVLRARERKQVGGRDSLVLTATVTNAVAGNPAVALNDSITVEADPDSLVPYRKSAKFTGGLKGISGDLVFDHATGFVTVGAERVAAPVGTHSFLSFLYAIRSFNLRPSKDLSNPVNDTRVAVFWGEKANVFTLRPTEPALIEIEGRKVPAQLVSVTTGIPQIDALGLKLWLSTDEGRVPLRMQIGAYTADLISVSNVPPA